MKKEKREEEEEGQQVVEVHEVRIQYMSKNDP